MFKFINKELYNIKKKYVQINDKKKKRTTFRHVGKCPCCGSNILGTYKDDGYGCEKRLTMQSCVFALKKQDVDRGIELEGYIKTVGDLKSRLLTVNSYGLGKHLESKFRHVISMFVVTCKTDIKLSYLDCVGVEECDYYEGTDFILNYGREKIRVDITARDETLKDNMELIKKYETFKLYRRTANKVHGFNESVLVYVVPYYEEERIVNAMLEIYMNMEDTVIRFKEFNKLKSGSNDLNCDTI